MLKGRWQSPQARLYSSVKVHVTGCAPLIWKTSKSNVFEQKMLGEAHRVQPTQNNPKPKHHRIWTLFQHCGWNIQDGNWPWQVSLLHSTLRWWRRSSYLYTSFQTALWISRFGSCLERPLQHWGRCRQSDPCSERQGRVKSQSPGWSKQSPFRVIYHTSERVMVRLDNIVCLRATIYN